MNSIRRLLVLLCTLTLLAVPLAAQESGSEPLSLKNIRVTIRYDTVEPDGTEMVTTRELVAQERSKARLLIGSRVPIAVSEVAREGADHTGPTITYAYQNIGFSAEIRAWVLPDGRISLEAEIESSRISPDTEGHERPVILTYQQQVQVVLQDGKPMHVTRVDDPERITGHFELAAQVVE